MFADLNFLIRSYMVSNSIQLHRQAGTFIAEQDVQLSPKFPRYALVGAGCHICVIEDGSQREKERDQVLDLYTSFVVKKVGRLHESPTLLPHEERAIQTIDIEMKIFPSRLPFH